MPCPGGRGRSPTPTGTAGPGQLTASGTPALPGLRAPAPGVHDRLSFSVSPHEAPILQVRELRPTAVLEAASWHPAMRVQSLRGRPHTKTRRFPATAQDRGPPLLRRPPSYAGVSRNLYPCRRWQAEPMAGGDTGPSMEGVGCRLDRAACPGLQPSILP